MNSCPYYFAMENTSNKQDQEFYCMAFRDMKPYEYTNLSRKNFTTEEALMIAKRLNIKFDKFDVEQFRIGLIVELEHGRVNQYTNITNDDPIITGKITLAHLNEFSDYYKRLTRMEEEAEEYWENGARR
jgi:hypothetical protein